MRLVISLMICLLAGSAFAYEAVVESSVLAPNGMHKTRWYILADQSLSCFSLAKQGQCLAKITPVPQGMVVNYAGQEKEVHGQILFDENAEIPWNLLQPDFDGYQEFDVRILATNLDLRRSYGVSCEALSPAELQNYDLTPQEDKDYRLVQVYRGTQVIAEQVWAMDEDFWLLDIRGEQRSVRVDYAP